MPDAKQFYATIKGPLRYTQAEAVEDWDKMAAAIAKEEPGIARSIGIPVQKFGRKIPGEEARLRKSRG